jgi:uncharacterized protein (UPF0261 family)
MAKESVIVMGTLDTKGEEILFLKQQLEQKQCRVIVVDVSMGSQAFSKADVGPDEIARLGGGTIEEIRASKDRNWLTRVMERGAMEKVGQLYATGEVGGIMAIGGSTMALLGARVMKLLPFGIPKIIVCPGVIPAQVRRLYDTMDMIIMQGVMGFVHKTRVYRSLLQRVTRRWGKSS